MVRSRESGIRSEAPKKPMAAHPTQGNIELRPRVNLLGESGRVNRERSEDALCAAVAHGVEERADAVVGGARQPHIVRSIDGRRIAPVWEEMAGCGDGWVVRG